MIYNLLWYMVYTFLSVYGPESSPVLWYMELASFPGHQSQLTQWKAW